MRLNDKRPNSNEIIGMPTDTNEQSRKFRNILEVDSAKKNYPYGQRKILNCMFFSPCQEKNHLKAI